MGTRSRPGPSNRGVSFSRRFRGLGFKGLRGALPAHPHLSPAYFEKSLHRFAWVVMLRS